MNLKRIYRKIIRFFSDRKPVFCADCRQIVFTKDARYERTTTGQTVPLCPSCHKAIFHPYSD